MNNRVTASVEFSFKGQTIAASVELDLDACMQTANGIPDLYHLLATRNNIGLYSYEYEMLQAEPISYSNAEGLVAEYVKDGQLDQAGFEAAWREQSLMNALQDIAREKLQIDDLQNKPDLKAALLAAYQLGAGSGPTDKQPV